VLGESVWRELNLKRNDTANERQRWPSIPSFNQSLIAIDDMAAAQNVRSGSSPGPTHDPDLRSRPPIQTFRKDLIQTSDPDLWNDVYIYI